mmetsp:Transcript_63557/g.138421  ORF Transcript_63557/g.138421 Transcript_63557/m.138421 type:complete len:158 (+) Transcript_63557:81-554(+)
MGSSRLREQQARDPAEACEGWQMTGAPLGLPDELLLHCLAAVPSQGGHPALVAVCRTLRKLSFYDSLWRERLRQDFPCSGEQQIGMHLTEYLRLTFLRRRASRHLYRRCPNCWPELGLSESRGWPRPWCDSLEHFVEGTLAAGLLASLPNGRLPLMS